MFAARLSIQVTRYPLQDSCSVYCGISESKETDLDTGLWITWYDLPATGRDEYLEWLHTTYIPDLLRRPGYLWAAHYAAVGAEARGITPYRPPRAPTDDPSVPSGGQYILVIGAENAKVFGSPIPRILHASLPETSRKMLSLRTGERMNLTAEGARVEGPEAKNYDGGMSLAPCIQIGSYNCPWQHEEDVWDWYVQGTMRGLHTLPGCVRMRKLASVAGWAKHVVIYEFISLEARNQIFVTHQNNRSPGAMAWAARTTKPLVHAPGGSSVARRIWPTCS